MSNISDIYVQRRKCMFQIDNVYSDIQHRARLPTKVLQTLLRVVQLAYDRYLVTVVQYEFNLQEATMGYNALSAMQQQVCKALDFPLAIVVAASVFGTAPYLVWVVTMSILSHGRAILLVEALSLGPGFCTVLHCLFLMLGITSKAELLPHVMKSLHFHGDSTIDHCTIVGYMVTCLLRSFKHGSL